MNRPLDVVEKRIHLSSEHAIRLQYLAQIKALSEEANYLKKPLKFSLI